MSKMDLHFSSESNEWETPDKLFNELNQKFGPFELDAAANLANTKVSTFYCEKNSGLNKSWGGVKVYLNPPYSKPEHACKRNCKKKTCIKRGHCISEYVPGQIDFVRKAYEESRNGCQVCLLIPARTDTEIFHTYIWDRDKQQVYSWVKHLDFLPDRVKFLVNGVESDSAPFPSMVVVFRHA